MEAYYLFHQSDSAQVVAVLKKHRLERDEVIDECYQLYRKKYGVDLKALNEDYDRRRTKAIADYLKQKELASLPGGPLPDEVQKALGPAPDIKPDTELYESIVLGRVANRADFVCEIMATVKSTRSQNPKWSVTDSAKIPLTDLTMTGNSATGRILRPLHYLNGSTNKVVTEYGKATAFFSKHANTWLIDGIE
jgi:hypothetical protein